MERPIDEHELNPAPHKYKVSYSTKIIFLLMFVVGVGAYFYMIINRRISQNKFMLENQMAALRLTPVAAPALKMSDPVSGEESSLSNYYGRWILVNMWATWCPACLEEMPSLELLEQQMGQKLKIIAISVDENRDAVKDFISAHKPSFSIFHDPEQKSARLLGVNKYPETFLISPEGVLTAQLSGPRDWVSTAALKYLTSIIK